MEDKRRKVVLPGHGTFWFLDDGSNSGPLAPLDQCDSSGELFLNSGLFRDSYAHVCTDGCIRRYLEVIGSVEDLLEMS